MNILDFFQRIAAADYALLVAFLFFIILYRILYLDFENTKNELKQNIEDEDHLRTGEYQWIMRDGQYVFQVEYFYWEMDRSWNGVRKFYWKDANPEEVDIVLKEPPHV